MAQEFFLICKCYSKVSKKIRITYILICFTKLDRKFKFLRKLDFTEKGKIQLYYRVQNRVSYTHSKATIREKSNLNRQHSFLHPTVSVHEHTS